MKAPLGPRTTRDRHRRRLGQRRSGDAFDFADHGHTVRPFDIEHFPDQVAAVAAEGGIHATGEIEGFAELVVLVGPAYSTEHQTVSVAPHLVPGQAVLVCPASCAEAITFKRTAGLALEGVGITVGETSTPRTPSASPDRRRSTSSTSWTAASTSQACPDRGRLG